MLIKKLGAELLVDTAKELTPTVPRTGLSAENARLSRTMWSAAWLPPTRYLWIKNCELKVRKCSSVSLLIRKALALQLEGPAWNRGPVILAGQFQANVRLRAATSSAAPGAMRLHHHRQGVSLVIHPCPLVKLFGWPIFRRKLQQCQVRYKKPVGSQVSQKQGIHAKWG